MQALVKSSGMRRARKDSVAEAWVRPEPVDFCLQLWKTWMKIPDRERGMNTMEFADRRPPKRDKDGNLVDAEQGGYESDTEHDQAREDMMAGAAVDAMVSSLSAIHRWAICRATGTATVWRFPSDDFSVVALEARQALEKKLRTHLATAVYFV